MELKMLTIRGTIRTNRQGSYARFEFYIDAEEWNGMTPEEQEEMAKEAAFENVDWSYDVIDDE